MTRSSIPQRLAMVASSVSAAAGLLILGWIGFYARMVADDFCTAASLKRLGILAHVAQQYVEWSGRFSFQTLTAAVAATGPATVRFLPAFTIAVLAGSAIFALRRLTRLDIFAASSVGLVATWAALAGSPDLFQSLYWTSGSLTYTLPIALVLLWAGLALESEVVRGGAHHVILTLAAGFAETITALLLGMLIIGIVFWRERRSVLGYAFLATLAGTFVMVAAPGNFVRAARFTAHRALDEGSLASAAFDIVRFAPRELAIAAPSLLLVAAVAASAGYLFRGGAPSGLGFRAITGILLVCVLALVLPFAMGRIIMGIPIPLRAVHPSHVVFVAACCAGGWFLGKRMPSKGAAAVAVLAIVLIVPLAKAVGEVSVMAQGAAAFARAWDNMDEQLRAAPEGADVRVHAPTSVGRLDFVTRSTAHWSNRCMADYYGLGTIGAR